MDKNDFINFRFLSSIYLKLKEKTVTLYDAKIQALHQQIKNEKHQFEQNMLYFDALVKDNDSLKKDYNNLMKLFENENKTISVTNNNYQIAAWENVYIKKKSSQYVLRTKREQDIYIFSEHLNEFIDYLLTFNHSIVVLSVDKKRIVLQIRLQR